MRKILNWPWWIIGIITILTIFFALQLPNIRINNAVEIFLPDDHPSKLANDKTEEIYGSSEVIAVAVKTNKDNILTKENLEILKVITDDLENIKNVEEITSIINADYIEGTAEGMEVDDLVTELPQSQDDILKIKERLISWEIYDGNLYSEDLKSTQISVKLRKDLEIEETEEVYFSLKDKLATYEDNNLEFFIAGSPAVNVLMGNNMKSDLASLVPFVILVVLISLYLSFKNLGGVVLPILTVLISTIWALGIMALLNIKLTMVSTVIPVLLVAVGSAYGIHIISHYYDDLRKEKAADLTEQKHRQIVLKTISDVGRPVALAALTTIAGFSSLAASSIIPIREFGIFTAVGVATALLVAITLIPSILLVRYKSVKSKTDKSNGNENSTINKVILALYHYFSENKVRILVLSLVIIIVSTYGMSKIVIDNIMVEMFKENTEIRQADDFINQKFSGTNILNILVNGEERGSLTDPEILKSMEGLSNHLTARYDEVKKVTSFSDFIKRMNKVMNYPEEEVETIDEGINDFGEENTSSFGEETTSSFGEENTSSFGEETTSSFGEEDTSSFGEETTSSFGESDDTLESEPSQALDRRGPSRNKISEKDMIVLLNQAIINADKLNLTGEEIVRSINRELNYKGEAYNEIPYDPSKYSAQNRSELKNLISQYLLMYSGGLDDLINDQLEPSKAKMMLQMSTGSNIVVKEVVEEIESYVDNNFPEGYDIEISGSTDMALAVNELIVSSQMRSIIISLIVVFLIVAINYKSVIAGIYGIIPLAFSLLINFGIMGYSGIRLEIGTSMVASIAIGIGVDYTVHFLAKYSQEREKSDDLELVCRNTLLSSGKAIIFNALSVAAGFAVLLFSNFNPLVDLGLLVAITMLTSSLAAMTILPALLNIFKPKFISRQKSGIRSQEPVKA
ncbi:MMPL family transporter [Natroniella acetigena]|uniref:efflux RND transporter permease subunit n=1 Tax=Natroniella acetigena TaxID=52004 RepID=UPI002009FF82|nr:MMPL family transporter [Natroniella acetigena]MCK8827521.1 MMPL family transporter [Natroniella acetigena]